MPACTYFDEWRIRKIKQSLTDMEIQELLDELNQIEGESWIVEQQEYPIAQSFLHRILKRKPNTRKSFTLYAEVNSPEYQVINFPPADSEGWGINWGVNRAFIVTYLLGYLGGRQQRNVANRTSGCSTE